MTKIAQKICSRNCVRKRHAFQLRTTHFTGHIVWVAIYKFFRIKINIANHQYLKLRIIFDQNKMQLAIKILVLGAYDNLLKWPFSYRVSFYLLDQNSDPSLRKHIRFSIKPNPCADNEPFLGQPKKIEKNASFGGAKFAKQEEVESRAYVKDDVVYLKIAVDCDGTAEP